MRVRSLSAADILDATGDVLTRVAAPWMGVLWLSELPLRFVQAQFFSLLITFGATAFRYRGLLLELATGAIFALALAIPGRAVFARACLLALRTGRDPGGEAWAVGLTPLLTQIYLTLVAEVLFFGLWMTAFALPLSLTWAALAPAIALQAERPGLVGPLRDLARAAASPGTLMSLLMIFAVAFLIVFGNLALASRAGLWLAGAVPGIDLSPWVQRLAFRNPRFLVLLWSGTCLLVEPFWLAAHVVYVHQLRARETGEDLRAWFERLRNAEVA